MENKEFFDKIEYSLNNVRDDAYREGYVDGKKVGGFDPYLMENINFSCELSEDDKRKELHKKQRLERGFDDTELWNLDTTILRFILPRLKAFKECTFAYPSDLENYEQWQEILQKMIDSIEGIINDDMNADYDGFELFKKYFFDLWW